MITNHTIHRDPSQQKEQVTSLILTHTQDQKVIIKGVLVRNILENTRAL